MTETPTPQAVAPSTAQRRGRIQGAIGWTSIALVAAIVVMANYIAFRRYQRFDWTSGGMFTLSPKSEAVLRDLQEDIDIYLFASRGEPSFEQADELLKRFSAASPHVLVHYVDPERQEAEFRILAQRYGIATAVDESGAVAADVAVVVARGERDWHIEREDLFGLDFGPMPGESEISVNVQAEQALAGAVLQVVAGRPTELCMTEGHGEWTVDEADERGLTTYKFALRHDNIHWRSLKTLGAETTPTDCDAILVLGPTRAFSPAEVNQLETYLRSGGNLLLALDPVIERDEILPSGFEDLLASLGVGFEPALVLEGSRDHLLGPNMAEFIATDFNDHETTRMLQGRSRVFFALARPVMAMGSSDAVTDLVRTTPLGFAKADLADIAEGSEPAAAEGDIQGPVGLAVALQVPGTGGNADAEDQPGGRLVVVGDTDFLQGPMLEAPELANLDFALAITGYVTERKALISIPPKTIKGGALMLTQEDLDSLWFKVVVLMPLATLIAGFFVWFNRRS